MNVRESSSLHLRFDLRSLADNPPKQAAGLYEDRNGDVGAVNNHDPPRKKLDPSENTLAPRFLNDDMNDIVFGSGGRSSTRSAMNTCSHCLANGMPLLGAQSTVLIGCL